jgi:hypothetical protein
MKLVLDNWYWTQILLLKEYLIAKIGHRRLNKYTANSGITNTLYQWKTRAHTYI